MKKLNIKLRENKKGITLVALVVTIVVLLILTGVSLNLLIGNNGIITRTQISKVSQELAAYKENMNLFIGEKQIETAEFDANTLTAYKNKLYYNTKSAEDTSGIEKVLGQIDNKYIEKIEIINGELCLNTTNNIEQKAAEGLGIKVNSWDVVDGVLLSSDKNLELINNGETVVIPPSIKKIGDGAFSSVNNIKKIVIPGTVEEIGANAFSNNTTLEEVTIEYGVKKVGGYAFRGCSSLTSIEFPDSVVQINGGALENCKNLENVKLSNSITSIAYELMSNCTNIKQISIPLNVDTIGAYAFSGCKNLVEVKMPAKTKYIGDAAFAGITSLQNIIVDTDNENLKFENGLLLSKDGTNVYFALLNLENIIIPEGVTTIPIDTFMGSNAKSIKLPNSIINISGNTFANMNNLEKIEVNEDNENYKVENENLLSKDGTILILYLAKGDIITIPDGVKIITSKAIKSRTAKEIILPNTLEEIKGWGVSEVYGVTKIEIPERVKPFDARAFTDTKQFIVSDKNPYIKSVNDTMILSKDGKKLYAVAKGIDEFLIPNTVEELATNCFYYHTRLANITLPNSVKTIRTGALGYIPLKTITIPESVTTIENNAFQGCSKLESIIINKSKDSISGSPWGCPIGARAVKWTK